MASTTLLKEGRFRVECGKVWLSVIARRQAPGGRLPFVLIFRRGIMWLWPQVSDRLAGNTASHCSHSHGFSRQPFPEPEEPLTVTHGMRLCVKVCLTSLVLLKSRRTNSCWGENVCVWLWFQTLSINIYLIIILMHNNTPMPVILFLVSMIVTAIVKKSF